MFGDFCLSIRPIENLTKNYLSTDKKSSSSHQVCDGILRAVLTLFESIERISHARIMTRNEVFNEVIDEKRF